MVINPSRRAHLCSAALVALLFVVPLQARPSSGHAELNGAWILNQHESDSVGGPPLAEAIRSEAMKRTQGLIDELLEAHEWFAITVRGDAVVAFVLRDGRTVRFNATATKERHEFAVGTVQTTTRWVNDSLVRELTAPDGSVVVETYAVSHAPRRLRVELRVSNWRLVAPLAMTRIYDDARSR